MDYKVISADTHLDTAWLPGDLFTDNAPAHLKDKMPYVTEGRHGGKVWEIAGNICAEQALAATSPRTSPPTCPASPTILTAWPRWDSSRARKTASTTPQTPSCASKIRT